MNRVVKNLEKALLVGIGYGMGSESTLKGIASGLVFFGTVCLLDFIDGAVKRATK